jgi:lipopolysaccharide transport system permease protein
VVTLRPGPRAELRLIREWARRDFNARYRQSRLRSVWTLIQPISLIAVYGVVFSEILRVDGDGLPYLSFIVAGVIAYRYVALGLGQITTLVDNANVLSKVYFPREVLPLSVCVIGLLDLAIGMVLLIGVAWAQDIPPETTLIALPLPIILLVLVTAGLCVVLSTVAVFMRDIVHVMPTVLQIVFFASPVMYPASQYPPGFGALADANPIAVGIEAIRDVALRHTWPPWPLLGLHLVLGALLFVGSIAYLRAIEHRIVDVA